MAGRKVLASRLAGGVWMLLLLAAVPGARAQPQFPDTAPVRSSSGQFIIFATRSGFQPPWLTKLSENTNYIRLKPALLAVSCERIKQKLWDQLGMAGPWRGKIFLNLHPAKSANDTVTVVREKSPEGWEYVVAMPDIMARDRFLRAMVEVLLSEIANRGAGSRPADVPTWLAEGFCGELRALNKVELFLPPPTLRVRGLTLDPQTVIERWTSPGQQARKDFRSRPPLTFQQLSWPAAGELSGQAGEVYDRSALLFVDSLLHLPDGAACFRSMLEDLPRYYNWQLAFLRAFRSRFQTPLDVEKWWALQVVYFTGRGLFDRWTREESLKKLDEALQLRIEVRPGEDELPLHHAATLQQLIRELQLPAQAEILKRCRSDLNLLRLRVAPDLVSLVDDYRNVLQTYLQRRGISGQAGNIPPRGPMWDRLAQETVARLNVLDRRRESFRTPAKPPTSTTGQAAVP